MFPPTSNKALTATETLRQPPHFWRWIYNHVCHSLRQNYPLFPEFRDSSPSPSPLPSLSMMTAKCGLYESPLLIYSKICVPPPVYMCAAYQSSLKPKSSNLLSIRVVRQDNNWCESRRIPISMSIRICHRNGTTAPDRSPHIPPCLYPPLPPKATPLCQLSYKLSLWLGPTFKVWSKFLCLPLGIVDRLLRVLVTFGSQKHFENMVDPFFEDLKHLQNSGHLLLTKPIIIGLRDNRFTKMTRGWKL